MLGEKRHGKQQGVQVHTTNNQRHDQVRHQGALGVVQVVLVAKVGLSLAANGVLLALLPALGDEALALGVMGAEVFGHPAALGQDNGLGIGAGGRDADDGRLAERVHLLELGRREEGLLVAVEDFDLVVDLELLEEPEDALGARLLEPMQAGLRWLAPELSTRSLVSFLVLPADGDETM